MLVPLVAIAALIATGAGFAYSTRRVRRSAARATVSLAIVLHICVSVALSAARTELLFQPHILGPRQAVALVVAAFVDLAGLWVPVALVPWAAFRERVLAVAAVLGAGAIAAPAFYLPFDVVILNDEVVGPSRIGYTLALLWGVPFVAIGYVLGNKLNWRGRATSAPA